MTVEEIFNKIATHMYEGVCYHDQLARIYDFLGLYGYSHCHLYHSKEEQDSYHYLIHYYSTHYHKLLTIAPEKHELIPQSWYKYTTMSVDKNTRQNAVKEYAQKQIDWERSTKTLYQEMRKELCEIGEIAAALLLDKYILDVTHELKHAEKLLLKLEAIGYDMPTIIDWQKPLKDKYTKKIGW